MCNYINFEGLRGEVSVIDQGGVDLGPLREKGMLIFIWAHL